MTQPHALGIDENTKDFHLGDVMEYITAGMVAIIDDNASKVFKTKDLTMWNFLTRTNFLGYEAVSVRVTLCWLMGALVRYCLLFPLRLIIGITAFLLFILSMAFIATLPDG